MLRAGANVILAFNLLSVVALGLHLLESVVRLVLYWRFLGLLVLWGRSIVVRFVQGICIRYYLRTSLVWRIQVFILHFLDVLQQKLL